MSSPLFLSVITLHAYSIVGHVVSFLDVSLAYPPTYRVLVRLSWIENTMRKWYYYSIMDWDQDGIPGIDTFKKSGLEGLIGDTV